jgi:hypothetical protein
MITLCGNRLRVKTERGYQDLTFKAATARGKRVRKEWLAQAFGPMYDQDGKPTGLTQSGRTRVISDLKRGLISRREATFLGIQFSLLVASRFKVLQLKEWDDFRRFLFKEVYEHSSITLFGKAYKQLTTAIGNHLLGNKLQENPRGQLEYIIKIWDVAKRIIDLLLRLRINFFQLMPDKDKMWYVAHLTQSRFLPGPSRSEVVHELVGLKNRLCGDRADWAPSQQATDSIFSAAYQVGSELTKTKGFRIPDQGHLSLSNSGCIEFSRRKGGKLALLWNEYKKFIERPVSYYFDITVKTTPELKRLQEILERVDAELSDPNDSRLEFRCCPLNARPHGSGTPEHYYDREANFLSRFENLEELVEFSKRTLDHNEIRVAYDNLKRKIEALEHDSKGTYDPLGNTICKNQYRDLPLWKIAYLEEPLLENQFREQDFIRFLDGTKVMETRAGVDSRFGKLLFLWSTIEFEDWDKSRQALPVEAVPISEPGVKSRVATKSLICSSGSVSISFN